MSYKGRKFVVCWEVTHFCRRMPNISNDPAASYFRVAIYRTARQRMQEDYDNDTRRHNSKSQLVKRFLKVNITGRDFWTTKISVLRYKMLYNKVKVSGRFGRT
jgi:hypothetical protein